MRTLVLVLLLTTTAALASPISDKYTSLGGAAGVLGVKTSEETNGANGGKFQHFQNGSIFWHPECGARAVRGAIRDRYQVLGWETSFLGYPITDQIGLADGSGQQSKFKGGQLMLRNGVVTELRATDLVVDLPFPVGEAWIIGQTNAVTSQDSHGGQWAYCMDINFANGTSGGRTFIASATSRIVHVDQNFDSGGGNPGNVVVQRFGEGRYGSYLHIGKGSYAKKVGNGGLVFLPQTLAWNVRPFPLSGTALGEVGDTGTGVNNHHMHFCVTTAPDRNEYGVAFESVPVAFRNYAMSTDQGKNWTWVPVGVPRSGQWVRRGVARGLQPKVRVKGLPKVNDAVSPISHGTVDGTVTGTVAAAGKLTIAVMSAWGEPLRSTTIDVPSNKLNGPWTFQLTKVPAYANLKVKATHSGGKSGESVAFNLAPNGTKVASAALQ